MKNILKCRLQRRKENIFANNVVSVDVNGMLILANVFKIDS